MKYIKLFSTLTIVVTIAAAIYSLVNFFSLNKATTRSNIVLDYEALTRALQNMKENSIQSPGDTISKKEYSLQISELQHQLSDIKYKSTEQHAISGEEFTVQRFWLKVIFSSILCVAALFVILSKKYDDETKKWAFSVLTLIAGVWIGTIS